MSAVLNLKVGDTIDISGKFVDEAGQPVDLVAAELTVACALGDPDGLNVYPLNVVIFDQVAKPGEYRITGSTADLLSGRGYRCDIRYTDAQGSSFSSETFTVNLAGRIA